MGLRLQGYNFDFEILDIYSYCSRYPHKDLLKFKELIHYVNFVADDATANGLTIDIFKK